MTACACICHGGPGAYPPPCLVPGGCGPHDEQARCQRGPHCEAAETDQQGQPAGAPSDRPLCRACEDATRQALLAAPGLYVDLRNKTIDRLGSIAQGERVTRSRSGSFGLNAGPLYLTESLHWHVTGWADEVIHTAGRPTVDRHSQPEGGQVQDACTLLARYLSVWVAHGPVEFAVTRRDADPDDPKAQPTEREVTVSQAGWEVCGWLIDWREAAERLLKIPVLIHYPPEPCPQCDTPGALRRRDGEDKVWCSECRKSWTLKTYETFVHAWLGGQPAPEPERWRGPSATVDGQDARTGTAAHAYEGAA